ncbi:MAG: endopeptidase La [Clostridia bacterium]|nr:endopeptidase La [Clostridia bacterium]
MDQPNTNISTMPMLALRGLVLFPQMHLHFDVGRPKSIQAIEHAIKNNTPIFLVAQKDIRQEDPRTEDMYKIGTIAKVHQILKIPGGDNLRVMVEGIERATLSRVWQEEPYIRAEVEKHPAVAVTSEDIHAEALMREAQERFEDYLHFSPRIPPEVILDVMGTEDAGVLADYIAQNLASRYEEKQKILEVFQPLKRLEQLILLLTREIEVLEITGEVQTRVHEQLEKNQKDYVLREQIKVIQGELGEGDDAAAEAEQYRKRIAALDLPEDSAKKLYTEVDRLAKMQPLSPESGVIRTYLDSVLELPWKKTTKERIDVAAARKVLDADHYGLEKVKERILEYVAVRQLSPELKGQILCLVGPPGVGKTSIGKSIARALRRNYARLSLGGVRDEADIRGHRKTYIGAMPGRIMNALRTAGSKNALLLLDEVDKLGSDMRGDPASALLEVLDTEQNTAFRDHYIEIPFDLSDVLFIVTANTTQTIPRPLLDRMELIELPSYTDEEKLQIAKRHLIPKQLKRHGLKRTQVRLDDDAIRAVIDGYTRESGVRTLEREISQVCRRAAKELVEFPDKKRISITAGGLEPYLGARKIHSASVSTGSEVGVVNGLAWTQVGGELLEVEVNVLDGSGKLELTGNLGKVMSESAHAALTYIRSRASSLGIEPDFYKKRDIHIHFPEAAVPKDGPSAGITVTTAMVSALTGIPVRRDVAMTGEVTLRGRVLPIGGLREKTMAALRNGIKTVIVPKLNEPDLAEIDPNVREKLHFVIAENMDTVLSTALTAQPRPCPTAEATPETVDSAAQPVVVPPQPDEPRPLGIKS